MLNKYPVITEQFAALRLDPGTHRGPSFPPRDRFVRRRAESRGRNRKTPPAHICQSPKRNVFN